MPKWFLDIRGRVPTPIAVLLGIIPIVVIILVWHFLTTGEIESRTIGPTILPNPLEVVQSIPKLFERDLFRHIALSLRRIGLGYLIALAITFPVGIFMGSFGSVRAFFSLITTASGYIPIATLVPLTMSWWGTEEKQKVYFLAMAFGIYLLPMIINAIDQVPDVYLRTAATLGASKTELVARVLVPIALPSIWQGMRLAFGVGWTYLVLTEVVVMEGGLGEIIAQSQRRGPREHIYLVIFLITLIAWLADIAWVQLGNLLFPYRRRR